MGFLWDALQGGLIEVATFRMPASVSPLTRATTPSRAFSRGAWSHWCTRE